MPEFTNDWFVRNIPLWTEIFAPLVGKPNVRVLEVGSYEGQSALWLADNVLTGDGSKLFCVDVWNDSAVCARFHRNVARHEDYPCYGGKIVALNRSLPSLIGHEYDYDEHRIDDESFDAIYIDGDHRALAVMTDSVLAWPMLKPGGLLIWDDYHWRTDDGKDGPGAAIEAFLSLMQGRFEVVHVGAQVVVRKTEDTP